MQRRVFLGKLAALTALGMIPGGCADAGKKRPVAPPPLFKPRRLPGSPIIRGGMGGRMAAEEKNFGYVNINGPSLIRAPAWVEKPLGKYYLYFGHHKGGHIRMAYADELGGPWKIHEPGVLDLANSYFPAEKPKSPNALSGAVGIFKRNPPQVAWALAQVGLAARSAAEQRREQGSFGSDEYQPHIAGPEAIVNRERQEVRLYYHGMLEDAVQMSRVAISKDGINFQGLPGLISAPYLRIFRYRGMYYGIAMPGIFYRSQDGLGGFEARSGLLFGVNMRHAAVLLRGESLLVFFSRVGDVPERILCAAVDLAPGDWDDWSVSEPVEIIRPELDWEGAKLDLAPSIRGEITRPANQLRDPAIFQEEGRVYLLYSCAGEQAIAIAELKER